MAFVSHLELNRLHFGHSEALFFAHISHIYQKCFDPFTSIDFGLFLNLLFQLLEVQEGLLLVDLLSSNGIVVQISSLFFQNRSPFLWKRMKREVQMSQFTETHDDHQSDVGVLIQLLLDVRNVSFCLSIRTNNKSIFSILLCVLNVLWVPFLQDMQATVQHEVKNCLNFHKKLLFFKWG